MTIAEKFEKLKMAQPGNRERRKFEYSFGMPQEEQYYITPTAPHTVRILSEIEFGMAMSRVLSGRFDSQIEAALDFLLASSDENGSITKSAAEHAEKMLDSLGEAAKEYTVICASHAHIDMNWMWSYTETVSDTLDTFQTMLDLMDEYPDFTYSQSQAAVYRITEEFNPRMMERIKRRIAEGRWEVTASTWVENDKNMPSTESLARHVLYTKKYLRDTWGVKPESMALDFSPDTFGHSRHLPEIISRCGVKYYYHCRAYDGEHYLYRWRAPSGQDVIAYREPYWYNSGITPHIGVSAPGLCDGYGMKTALIVYGVGNHGGGPTRRDIERIINMNTWPVFPNIKFGTFADFYAKAEEIREKLPVVDFELNYFSPGCYTTQSRIKLGNRKSEAGLGDAEALSAIANVLTDSPYERGLFEKGWRNVLFTHFHDILTGSCVQDTREHAMGLYQDAIAVANTQRSIAMREIAEQIDTSSITEDGDIAGSQSEGAGAGYGLGNFSSPSLPNYGAGKTRIFHVFNPSPHDRKQVIELTVWDWTYDMTRIQVADSEGREVRTQLVDTSFQKYWDHQYFRLLIDTDLPPMGYATYILSQKPLEEYRHYLLPNNRSSYPLDKPIVMENELIRAVIDGRNAQVTELTDKKTGNNMLDIIGPAGFEFLELDPRNDSAWVNGRHVNITPLNDNARITNITAGEGMLRQSVSFEQVIRGESKIKGMISLDADKAALVYNLEIDFHEYSTRTKLVPQLNFTATPSYVADTFIYDVPGGSVERNGMGMDAPANSYCAAKNPDGGPSLMITTDCKYGFRCMDGDISVTLIHASSSPDPYPERGIHTIQMALGLSATCSKALHEMAFDINHQPVYMTRRAKKGTRALRGGLLSLSGGTAVLSGVKLAEDGSGMILRLYETCGKDTVSTVKLPKPATGAYFVDILENSEPEPALSTSSETVNIPLKANTLRHIRITFK